MGVTGVIKDADAFTMAVESEWDAPVERVWELWSDPRKLERWWGPPTFPATFTEHQFEVGGAMSYFMTGPEGEVYRGWWTVTVIDPLRRLEFTDGFADEQGEHNDNLPISRSVITFEALSDTTTRMVITTFFASTEQMAQMLEMGMEEGMSAAVGQIEGILVEG